MKCQKSKFRLQGKITYLNCAYMSPLLKKVENAGRKGIAAKRKPYKIGPDDFFEDSNYSRLLFSKIINTDDQNRCVIIPSVSYGIANVVNNLPKKSGKVILAGEQFPSNVYPWKANANYDLKFVVRPQGSQSGEKWNADLLNAINDDVAVISIGNVHWADGTLFDLKAIGEKARKHDCALIIDGTQSIGAFPFDQNEIKADAIICAGYKWLMGPYSIGMAYYGEIFDNGTPVENNWIARNKSEDFSGLVNYADEYQEGSIRYEVGEKSNFILVPMLNAAMKQILKWNPASIQQYCENLIEEPLEEISSMGYQIEDKNFRGSHLFGIRIPKEMEISNVLKNLKTSRINISTRGDALRISPNVYNDERDLRKLVRALKSSL